MANEKSVVVAKEDLVAAPEFVKMNEMDVSQIKGMRPMEIRLIREPRKAKTGEVIDQFYKAQIVIDVKLTVTIDPKKFGQIEYNRIIVDRKAVEAGPLVRIAGFGRFCKGKRPDGSDYYYVQVWASKNVYLKYYFKFAETDYIADMILAGAGFKDLIWVDTPHSEIELDVDLGETK